MAKDGLYKTFVADTAHQFCWNCRCTPYPYGNYRPSWWHAPFIIERAHIVGGPGRKEVREAVILLCSLCHRLQHGDTFTEPVPHRLTLAEMIWLKQEFDPEFFDFDLLDRCSIKRLPDPQTPPHYETWLREPRRDLREFHQEWQAERYRRDE